MKLICNMVVIGLGMVAVALAVVEPINLGRLPQAAPGHSRAEPCFTVSGLMAECPYRGEKR